MKKTIKYLYTCGIHFKKEHCNTDMEISYLKKLNLLG